MKKQNKFFKRISKPIKKEPIKKEQKPFEFPSIYRKITELPYFWWSVVASLILLVLIGFTSFITYKAWREKEEVSLQRQKVVKEVAFWEDIVKQYPNYRDAYYTLSVLSYRLKEYDKAKMYLGKALFIDPNFEKGRELEKILNEK